MGKQRRKKQADHTGKQQSEGVGAGIGREFWREVSPVFVVWRKGESEVLKAQLRLQLARRAGVGAAPLQ